jgi:hypothetical protein
MSHFSSIQTQLTDQAALIKGLEALCQQIGITPIVEVHDQLTLLENAYDPENQAYAHVIIRRRQIPRPDWRDGIAAIDLGFRRGEDGCFSAIVDPWDLEYNAIGQYFQTQANTKAFLKALQTQHNIAYVQAQYPDTQWDYSDWVTAEDGSLQLTLTQKVDLALV